MAVTHSMNASQRRLVFGLNALLQALLAILLVVGVLWLVGRFKWQVDTTQAGVNSLSQGTTRMLHGLTENIRITAVFPEPDKERNPLGEKHYRQIRDLFELYDAAGRGHVTTHVLDPSLQKGETDALLKRLTALPAYRDEAKPHQEALEKFTPLNEKIQALVTGEVERLGTLAAADPRLAQNRTLVMVQNTLQALQQMAATATDDVQALQQGEIPRYGPVAKAVRDYLNRARSPLREVLNWMKGDALSLPALTPELHDFFAQSPSRYDAVLTAMDDQAKALEGLADVKLDQIYMGLTRWNSSGPPVLVESDREARLLSFSDVWPRPADNSAPPAPDGDDVEFAGESAISSAILQLTQKDQTAVIFTRFGGESPIKPDFSRMDPMMRQMPRAPYQRLNDLLQKANFLTEDWDVAQAKTPPEIKNAARQIYVVFPPEPPPRQNPMQPAPAPTMTPQDRQIVLDAVGKAGMAMFLVGWTPPSSPLPGASGPYEYADYLKSTWGVDAQNSYLTLAFTANPDKPGWKVPAGREPRLITTDESLSFTDQQIAAPLRGASGAFFSACPLRILTGGDKPAGVTAASVADVRPTEDVWAVSDISRLEEQGRQHQGFRRTESDLVPPFSLAVAASSDKGPKAVIFGSELFAADDIAQARGLMAVGNTLAAVPLYPANSDLFLNSLHWLTGDANRIAVGPQRGDVPRLKRLDEAWAGRLPWLFVGVWPAVALAVGVCVWLVRRR